MSDHNGFSNGNKADEDARKLFVGGLPPSADKAEVESYFSQFGEVEMCTIKTDQFSGRSRGFGFLIFKDVDAVNKVLADPDSHMIQDKKIDPKLATPQAGHGRQEEKSTKVFVGGLDKATSKEELTSIFAQRGNVVDVYLPTDKMTNEPKGFAFVNFDSSEIVETLINEAKITINGKECDLKKATNKSDSSRGGRGGFRGGRGGFRGGRGGYGGGYDQYGGGYDQYNSGYGGGYQGGYQSGYGNYGGGYDQYSSGGGGGYDQSGAAYGGGYGGGYDQQQYGDAGYGAGNDQYKMKSGRGRGGASTYQPY